MGANRRATFHKCVSSSFSFFRKRDDLSCAQVRRRRSRRFRPSSLPVACRNLSPKRTSSSLLHHYGEYPLVFTRGDSHPWLTRVVRRRLDFPAQPPLFHGAATTIPHRLRFASHPRYSVASLLTNPLRRHGSEPARNISQMRVALLFIFLEARRPFVRAGSAAAQPTLSPFPAARGVLEPFSQTHLIFVASPLWRISPRLHPRGFSPLADASCSAAI